jgi:hypothetical protein
MLVPPLSSGLKMQSGDWRAAAAALLLVPTFHVLVRTVGFARLNRRLERRRSVKRGEPTAAAEQCAAAIRRVKRYSPLRGNCLSQSIALAWMLRGRGITPDLRLGARLNQSNLEAHAWVEWRGRVLNDTVSVSARFAPFGSAK